MLVTESLLDRVKTLRGGYTLKQLKVLGEDKKIKGWKKRSIGKDVKNWRILFYERDKSYENAGKVYKPERTKPEKTEPQKKMPFLIPSKNGLDVTYSDTWDVRQKNLEISYSEFLNSDHWLAVKRKAKSRRKTYGKCMFCGSTHNIDLHHTSYKWIGTNHELRNVIPLCRFHHKEVHDYAKENGFSVRIATIHVRKKYKK
jgi:hypothetical protein